MNIANESAINNQPRRALLWFVNSWQDILVWAWTVVVLSADLKVSVYPYIHWLTTALFLVPVFLATKSFGFDTIKNTLIKNKLITVPSILLVCAVLISSFNSSNPLYGLAQSGKLIAILIWANLFFIMWSKYAHTSFKGFIAAAYLNAALLILGVFLLPIAAHEMATGRWGTILNYPGSLGKIGLIIFIYAVYKVLTTEKFSFADELLLCFTSMIVYFDGSRTGLLALLGGVFFVLIIRILEFKKGNEFKCFIHKIFYALISLVIFWAIILFPMNIVKHIYPAQQQGGSIPSERNVTQPPQGFDRISENIGEVTNDKTDETIEKDLLQKFARSDPARLKMLRDGLAAVKAHPFWGTGIGSTLSTTNYGTMVIHNSYIQVWADLGIIGLIAFTILVLGWIAVLPKAYRKIKYLNDPERRAVYYAAIFSLCYFAFNGLFHPLSTEWSEWITFIIPFALYWEVSQQSIEV